MGNWEFYDDDEDMEISETEKEPSFSFYEFKKWLSKQRRETSKTFQETVEENSTDRKDMLKKKFKDKVRKRIEENVQKKLDDKSRKQA